VRRVCLAAAGCVNHSAAGYRRRGLYYYKWTGRELELVQAAGEIPSE
jgi:hypothetical protein